jgi:hypothetical protein
VRFLKLGFDKRYLSAFLVILGIEVLIALFIKDGFIRTHLGDILVVILIYCFIRTFIRNILILLPFYIFLFASLVEIGQYFNMVERLGLGQSSGTAIILGQTFDPGDIVSYFLGCSLLFLYELAARKIRKTER